MENVIEEGCEKCGNKIMKEALIPSDSDINPNDLNYSRLAGNEWAECGHLTDIKKTDRFQCTSITHANIYKICSETEIKQLRLDLKRGMAILNKKLDVIENPRFEVDFTTTPPTIHQTGDQQKL